MTAANYINHIALLLDASSSMTYVAPDVIKVADNQIAYLARRSQEMDQETRITVASFASRGSYRMLIWDKDVMRMPSIATLYSPYGNTALIDATLDIVSDLALTPEKYGDHSFLVYVLTDGEENNSQHRGADLLARIQGLPDHWTLAAFVPNQVGVHEAKRVGFPADNVAVWDATTARGVEEAGRVVREATERYMTGRAQGVRGTRKLFANAVSTADVKKALVPLTPGSYLITDPMTDRVRIDEYCQEKFGHYDVGACYYQFSKRELIQGNKNVAVLTGDGKLYSGRNAREFLGLPDYDVKINPASHSDCVIFVQSTSHNRVLPAGTRLLVLR